MRLRFYPTYSEQAIYDREYTIAARLHIHIDYEQTTVRRFMYLADCVARDIKREEEAQKKRAALLRRKGYELI